MNYQITTTEKDNYGVTTLLHQTLVPVFSQLKFLLKLLNLFSGRVRYP